LLATWIVAFVLSLAAAFSISPSDEAAARGFLEQAARWQSNPEFRGVAMDAAAPALLVLVLWVGSYGPGSWHLRSADGRLFAYSVDLELSASSPTEAWSQLEAGPIAAELTRVSFLGVRWISHGGGSYAPFIAISIPCAYVLAVTLVPLWWYRRWRRRQLRSARNRCVSCGYDLRVSPERCPECGTIAVEAKA
jgi:hypothetical protein